MASRNNEAGSTIARETSEKKQKGAYVRLRPKPPSARAALFDKGDPLGKPLKNLEGGD